MNDMHLLGAFASKAFATASAATANFDVGFVSLPETKGYQSDARVAAEEMGSVG